MPTAVDPVIATVAASKDEFCLELARGAETAKENLKLQRVDSSLAGDLAALSNIGEFSRLVDRLDERAPAEIRSDMAAAREYWRKQQEAFAGVASDPAGSLLKSVVAGVSNQASLVAVDRYAKDNCGVQLFGLLPFETAPSPTPEPSSSPQSSSGMVYSWKFHLKVPEGWEYDVDFSGVSSDFRWVKDVSLSPPGKARLVWVSPTTPPTFTATPTIPGRTAPKIGISGSDDVSVFFRAPALREFINVGWVPNGCSEYLSLQVPYEPEEISQYDARCGGIASYRDTVDKMTDIDEALADKWIAGFDSEAVVAIVPTMRDEDGMMNKCDLVFLPDGRVWSISSAEDAGKTCQVSGPNAENKVAPE